MSVAAYKLNQIDKAREYIKLARETMDEPTKYMETMIKAYQIYLSNANDERKEMGLAGRKKVEKEFDRQIVVDAYLSEVSK